MKGSYYERGYYEQFYAKRFKILGMGKPES